MVVVAALCLYTGGTSKVGWSTYGLLLKRLPATTSLTPDIEVTSHVLTATP
jgi:hypothetical protein